jgi:hypothetical protein
MMRPPKKGETTAMRHIRASRLIAFTNSTAMGVSYSSSTTQTNDNSLEVTGAVEDTINRGFQPYVEIWQDDLFDTPMYRDPSAPAAP